MAVIEVYADIWCPFTHVGLRPGRGAPPRTGEPTSASMSGRGRSSLSTAHQWTVARAWGPRPGAPRAEIAPDMFQGVRMGPHSPPPTLPALSPRCRRVRQLAKEIGERVSFALRDALFEAGLDVSRITDVLERHCRATTGSALQRSRTALRCSRSGTKGQRRGGSRVSALLLAMTETSSARRSTSRRISMSTFECQRT